MRGGGLVLILVVGASGVGKDTLLNGARAALGESDVRFVRRVITRAEGAGEEAHECVSDAEFERRDQAGEFVVSWRAHGLRYGLPAEIAIDLARGRTVVANVSRAVIKELSDRFMVSVIEVVASPAVRAARLAARGREAAEDVARRMAREIELPLRVTRLTVMNDGSKEQGVARLLAALRETAGLDAVQG